MSYDRELADELYSALRDIALKALRGGRSELEPTELVNETLVRVVGSGRYDDLARVEFLALCATLMRRILVDEARRRVVRGQDANRRLTLAGIAREEDTGVDLLGLDEALNRLAGVDPEGARVVELRFFGGLSVADVAEALDVSERKVHRDWVVARAWLKRELGRENDSS